MKVSVEIRVEYKIRKWWFFRLKVDHHFPSIDVMERELWDAQGFYLLRVELVPAWIQRRSSLVKSSAVILHFVSDNPRVQDQKRTLELPPEAREVLSFNIEFYRPSEGLDSVPAN